MLIRRKSPEQWLPIAGYEGIYEVSNRGSIRSHRFWRGRGEESRGRPHKLGLSTGEYGHMFARLFSDGTTRTLSVGRLMLLAFKGPDPDPAKKWACHWDGNPANNVIDNLYWGTNSDNQMDRVRHGTSNRGSRNGHAKLKEEDARDIKSRIKAGERNRDISLDYPHVDPSVISGIRIGRLWAHL